MSSINDPPPIGPHYARPKPVEAQSRQAGHHNPAPEGDVLAIHGGQSYRPPEPKFGSSAHSRAYLILVSIVAGLLLVGTWWGGQMVLVGVGLGWVTGLLLWTVRKDLMTELRDLLG